MAEAARLVTLEYAPRRAFLPYHERAQRWAAIVAHRRAGKTVACVNDLIRRAVESRKPNGRYAYIAPLFNQAKDTAWTYLKQFSWPLLAGAPNESELRVDLVTGDRIRLYGADNPDRLRGLYLDGVVLDEYADMKPRLWREIVRPALADRKGWATFIGTPKGKNEFWDIWDRAQGDRDWFTLMLKASETGLLAKEELADAQKTMSEDEYAQEFECSFEAAIKGAYYGKLMAKAAQEGRIGRVPHDPAVAVHTAWDLGIGDSTAIWFGQRVAKEWHIIDFIENDGTGLDWYVQRIRERPWTWGTHLLPHDAEARELGTGKTRVETLRSLELPGTIQVVPLQNVDDGINATRLLLPRCWFDAEKCKAGIEALRQYRKDWDEEKKTFRDRPRHDWASHAADAFRQLAQAEPRGTGWSKIEQPKLAIV